CDILIIKLALPFLPYLFNSSFFDEHSKPSFLVNDFLIYQQVHSFQNCMRIDTQQSGDFICRWDLRFLRKYSSKYGIFKLLSNLNEDWFLYIRIYIQS